MVAISVDGNRKHYRFKNAARYFKTRKIKQYLNYDDLICLTIIILMFVFIVSFRSEEKPIFDGLFIEKDKDVANFVDYIHKTTKHV